MTGFITAGYELVRRLQSKLPATPKIKEGVWGRQRGSKGERDPQIPFWAEKWLERMGKGERGERRRLRFFNCDMALYLTISDHALSAAGAHISVSYFPHKIIGGNATYQDKHWPAVRKYCDEQIVEGKLPPWDELAFAHVQDTRLITINTECLKRAIVNLRLQNDRLTEELGLEGLPYSISLSLSPIQ